MRKFFIIARLSKNSGSSGFTWGQLEQTLERPHVSHAARAVGGG